MRHPLLLAFTALVLAIGTALPAGAKEDARVYYVAPGGNDAWSGRTASPDASGADGPFATLGRARDAARACPKTEASVRIVLRGGTYELQEPLQLGPEDSGSAAAPVTWAAHPGETPVLSGGTRLIAEPVADDGVWSAHIPAATAAGGTFRQLFVRPCGATHYQRRYRPMRGPFVVAGLTDAPARKGMRHRRSQDEFRFHPGDVKAWANLEDVEVVVLHDWSASRLRIRAIDDEAHVVRFTGYPLYRVGHWWKDARNPYWIENVKEAWGTPGEWYLDRPTATLRYRPHTGEDAGTLEVVAPRLPTLVRLTADAASGRGVEHVHFEGLTFAHTSWTLPPEGYGSGQGMIDLPAAFEASGAHHCRVERCTFAHLGAYAIALRDGSSQNRVVGSVLWDLGGGGVMVGGGEGLPQGNVVLNNLVSDGGLDHFSAIGIWAGITDGTEIRHNVIRRFPYTGVSIGWKWDASPTEGRANVVADNHIHAVMRLLADGGGIYSLGWLPETVFCGNHIHDIGRSQLAGRAPNNGIFFDQGSKGYRIEENAIHDTSGTPVRFNQSKRAWHAWKDNHLGTAPPDAITKRAGLETAFRRLGGDLPAVPVAPMLLRAPPDER